MTFPLQLHGSGLAASNFDLFFIFIFIFGGVEIQHANWGKMEDELVNVKMQTSSILFSNLHFFLQSTYRLCVCVCMCARHLLVVQKYISKIKMEILLSTGFPAKRRPATISF